MGTKAQIKAFIASTFLETGEKLSTQAAKLLMERQAEHDAEAKAGNPDDNMGRSYDRVSGIDPSTEEGGMEDGDSELNEEWAPPVVAPIKATAPVQVLRVKRGMPFRGARKAWYELLTQYDGKPAAEFLAAATAERPSKYGARSKHCGQAEPVAGWFRFFLRVGAARVE